MSTLQTYKGFDVKSWGPNPNSRRPLRVNNRNRCVVFVKQGTGNASVSQLLRDLIMAEYCRVEYQPIWIGQFYQYASRQIRSLDLEHLPVSPYLKSLHPHDKTLDVIDDPLMTQMDRSISFLYVKALQLLPGNPQVAIDQLFERYPLLDYLILDDH